MSLKAFHIFFILTSALLAFGFAVWSCISFGTTGHILMLVTGICSCIAGIGLIVYGMRFLKKLKHVSFI